MNNPLIRQSVEELTAYTPGEQPSSGGIIKLNTNENPYPPSPQVDEVLKKLAAGSLRLYPDPLSRALRHKIAEIHECDVSQVFAGNGSDEILALCTRAYVEDRGSIGYFNPSYSLYPVLADIRDADKRPVELGKDFEWVMPAGYQCSLFFLTNPNAPTSQRHSTALVEQFARALKGVLVIDEAYADFARENCMELAQRCPNVLVMRTLSKSYSLAGLRVGYAVGNCDLIDALFKIKDSYNLDRISQALAFAALSDPDYMRANVARIVATRDRFTRSLEAMGHSVFPSETNFLWIKPAGVSARRVFELLRIRRIMVRYFEGPRTAEFLRITVGTDKEMDDLLSAMKGLVI